jgi:glucan phosphoethanolaminetransferase (alkaline phosphatase superfamily)
VSLLKKRAGNFQIALKTFLTCFLALYGVLFLNEEEAAFSNYRLWESIGFVIAYIYANYLRINVKLIVISCVLGIGMIGYYIIEYKIFKNTDNFDLATKEETSTEECGQVDKKKEVNKY